MKRIATVQDISCLGKCSLTVALPIISAMGTETCVLPTAMLSTHTMFSRFTFCDLTDELPAIIDHWAEEEFRFDAIYTGYLGSRKQIELVEGLFRRFRRGDNLMIVDPVFADNGKLYPGFDEDYAARMAGMCGLADIIVPNLTEASYLLGIPYVGADYDRAYIRMVLKKLTGLGARCAVLTGVSFEKGKIGVMAYHTGSEEFFEYYNDRVDASYHGTGDIFASTMVGGLMRGLGLPRSLELAADYTRECIRVTREDPQGVAYGVNFETVMPQLLRRLEEETAAR